MRLPLQKMNYQSPTGDSFVKKWDPQVYIRGAPCYALPRS